MFKIVAFKGGVGNQLFQYCFLNYLRENGNMVYYVDETHDYFSHNGLEIDTYFDVDMSPMPIAYSIVYRFLKRYWRSVFNSLSTADDVFDAGCIRYDGYWQDKKYFSDNLCIRFKDLTLTERNKTVLSTIESSNSVSIHVRRGDYMLGPNVATFGGVCNELYYSDAISMIKSRVDNPHFFVFSDDIPWCRDNLEVENAEYIDWNHGADSIYDMYLMSKCKNCIIANSTFSYWGARLGNGQLVVFPKRWFANLPPRDIFPEGWCGI